MLMEDLSSGLQKLLEVLESVEKFALPNQSLFKVIKR